jgi:hypothetical protein
MLEVHLFWYLFRRLTDNLDRAHYLTPEQELRRKTIQKLKLAGKDQMMAMVRAAAG